MADAIRVSVTVNGQVQAAEVEPRCCWSTSSATPSA